MRLQGPAVTFMAMAIVAIGCTENKGAVAGAGDASTATARQSRIIQDAVGPAEAPAGAKPGGTITVLMLNDFEHLDPAQNYVNTQQVAALLFQRTLTAFHEKADGSFDLVGDLATSPGSTPDSGRTWTFTLRDSLMYEDGTPITSRDIAYGIARSFSPQLPNGAHYIQQWLANDGDYNAKYKGPYDGGGAMPPNVETPDDRTIVFRFAMPRPDMPFAASMPNTAPVPQAKDTRAEYDNRPFASGPYRIATYQRGQRLVLVKNPYWKAASDPVRTQNPDTIQFFSWGLQPFWAKDAKAVRRSINARA